MTMFQNLRRSLPEGRQLQVECGACGRKAAFTRTEAVRRFGEDAAPMDIRRKLVCRGCGAKGAVLRVWI